MTELDSTPRLYVRTISRSKAGTTVPIPIGERRRLSIEGGRDVVALRTYPTIDDPQLLVARKIPATHKPYGKWPVRSGSRTSTVRSSGNVSIPPLFAKSRYLTPPLIEENLKDLSEFLTFDLRKDPKGISEFLAVDWRKVCFLGRTGSANMVIVPQIVLAERLAPTMEVDVRNFLLGFIAAVHTQSPDAAINPTFTTTQMAQAFPEARF